MNYKNRVRTPFLLLVVSILCSIFSTNAQAWVMKELDKLPNPVQQSAPILIPLKSALPYNLWQTLGGTYLGISDANLDAATSREQAYLRALSMVALQNGMAKGMSDFFNNANGNQISSNFEELCEIKAHCNLPLSAIKVTDSLRLASGEMVLMLSIDSSATKASERISLNSIASIYYKENESDGYRHIINKIMLENMLQTAAPNKEHAEKSSYILSNNRWAGKKIEFDKQKVDIDNYKFFYNFPESCKMDTTGYEDIGATTIDGLWTACVGSVYRQLFGQLKPGFYKIKNISEKYNDKMTTLSRESGFIPFSCQVQNGVWFENKLLTKINVNSR
jgi:hypothetical protein